VSNEWSVVRNNTDSVLYYNMATATCRNCDTIYLGKYCPECGQSAHTGRIDARYIVHDLPHAVFHVDKGILYSLWQLLIRPGKAVAEYVDGKRVNHFKPFSYLIILTSIAAVLSHWVNAALQAKIRINEAPVKALPAAKHGVNYFIYQVSPFFDKYPSLFFLCMIPLVSLLTWLYYKKRGFNYWENIILNTYLTAQFNICLILLYLFVLTSGRQGFSFTPWLIVFFSYLGFAYGQFFSYQRKRVNLLANLLVTILTAFLYINGLSFTGMMTPWWS
jgi:hypothetical protein